MTASLALPGRRAACTDFVRMCQWKGSAGPRTAEKVVEDVWAARDAGKESGWREVMQAIGGPLII